MKLPRAGKPGDNVSRSPKAWEWVREGQRKPWERIKTEQNRQRQTDSWPCEHSEGRGNID